MDLTSSDRRLIKKQLIDRRKQITEARNAARFPIVNEETLGGQTIR